jgi:hypothetical protein
MIRADIIPDEVVEAAAIAAMKDGGCGLTVEDKHVLCCDSRVKGLVGAYGESLWCDVADCSCYTMARAAIAAAFNAWPGAEVVEWYHADKTLILPLPQEARDGL